MLENFQLAAIIRLASQTRLLRIPLHQSLQKDLAQTWQEQYHAFVEGMQEIDFDAGYKPEDHEHFRLAGFGPPEWLAEEDSRKAATLDPITHTNAPLDAIRAIAAFARNDEGDELILFQNFNRSHVIRPGWVLFQERDTYKTIERPGLTLDKRLSALYLPAEGKLLFHNFGLSILFCHSSTSMKRRRSRRFGRY